MPEAAQRVSRPCRHQRTAEQLLRGDRRRTLKSLNRGSDLHRGRAADESPRHCLWFREACLTCSVFVTDTSHLDTLQRLLHETAELIERTTEQFQKRRAKPMPDHNVWLAQRTAERTALVKLIATIQQHPAQACQGAGSATTGPVSITTDTTSYQSRVS
jgi:hypothetical protein